MLMFAMFDLRVMLAGPAQVLGRVMRFCASGKQHMVPRRCRRCGYIVEPQPFDMKSTPPADSSCVILICESAITDYGFLPEKKYAIRLKAKNTQKIAKRVESCNASKMRKAQERMRSERP